jgi:hypothetical protein
MRCAIAIGSPEISRQVQEALFTAGFQWSHSGQRVRHTDVPFITVWGDRDITRGGEASYISREIQKGFVRLISSQEVIANPFQLDGAKSPVKEMTVEELEKALGHPVKVVK